MVGPDPKVLILGTIPSVLSDRKKEYYGNPQNQFWRVVHQVFDSEPSVIYKERLEFLKERGIALWDVLGECDIRKSIDPTIVNPVANDIPALLKANKGIGHVFFNGKKASELFKELVRPNAPQDLAILVSVTLPSSSTANAVKMEEKVASWKIIRTVLGP